MRSILLVLVLLVSAKAFILPVEIPERNGNNTDLEFAENEECSCKNGRCVTDKRRKMKCACNPKHSPTDDETCQPCDCGKKGKCIFQMKVQDGTIQYKKMCVCDKGSAEKNGNCVDCHCGKNSLCEFDGDEKFCYCEEGYSENNEVCTECDCGANSESCGFERGEKTCVCSADFAPRNGTCRVPCSDRDQCYNGGMCIGHGEHKFCKCMKGTSDDLCKTVDDCEWQDFCGLNEDVECVFDGMKGGVCKCHDASKLFNPVTKDCQRTCDDEDSCRNNGDCTLKDDGDMSGKFCDCKPGTIGDHCEIVENCQDPNFCGTKDGVICEYDGMKEGICKCKDPSKSFNPLEKTCQKTCNDEDMCENNGDCVFKEVGGISGKFCDCKPGTIGDHCESVEDCEDQNLCGEKDDVKCEYDGVKGGICKCEDPSKSFNPHEKRCQKTCHDEDVCKNNGDCITEEIGSISGKFCGCKPGTTGDHCETVEDCEDQNFCGTKHDVTCEYDGVKGGICICEEASKSFNPLEKTCQKTCNDENECKNNGDCIIKEVGGISGKFCDCSYGTTGDHCEIVEDCEGHNFCGMKDDVTCKYDGVRGGICKCEDPSKSFNPSEKTCKIPCYDDVDCSNGAKCEGENEKFCDCMPGTSNDFCSLVEDCDNIEFCGEERNVKCIYDGIRGGMCKCEDEDKSFDPVTKKCRRTCSSNEECGKGGNCTKGKFSSAYCECLDGYEGELCEVITGCKELGEKCAKAGATCVFDWREERRASCLCGKDKHVYDRVTGTCQPACINGEDCGPDGACVKGKFCYCKEGYEDVGCRIITGCKELKRKCDLAAAACVFDETAKNKARCKCGNDLYVFDPISGSCKPSCINNTDCGVGGTCMNRAFCDCKDGYDGVGCRVITGCRGLETTCVSAGARCVFDENAESKARCLCNQEQYVFDKDFLRCRWSCEKDEDCDHGGNCSGQGEEIKSCHCLVGTSGNKCDVIEDCESGKYRHCRGKNGTCIFDVKLRTARCECGGNQILDEEKNICKERTCNESTCRNGRCKIVKGKEVCSCFEGYVLEGDECRKQNCSKTPCINGTCIVRHKNVEECVCPAGFTLEKGTCKRGICKKTTCYGGKCETIDGELVCVCPPKYHHDGKGCFETQCVKQRCYGGECVVENKEEICTCLEGYILVKEVCKKILCKEKSCFGGKCNIVDGKEECTCPPGFSIYDDVCRDDRIRHL